MKHMLLHIILKHKQQNRFQGKVLSVNSEHDEAPSHLSSSQQKHGLVAMLRHSGLSPSTWPVCLGALFSGLGV